MSIRVSYSSIRRYLECPYRWYIERYTDISFPPYRSDSLSIGIWTHEYIAHGLRFGKIFSEDSLPDELYFLAQRSEDDQQTILEKLKKLYRKGQQEEIEMLIEHPLATTFTLRVHSWTANNGYFIRPDLVIYDTGERELTIYDWKTGHRDYYINDYLQEIQFALTAIVLLNTLYHEAKTIRYELWNLRTATIDVKELDYKELSYFFRHEVKPLVRRMRATKNLGNKDYSLVQCAGECRSEDCPLVISCPRINQQNTQMAVLNNALEEIQVLEVTTITVASYIHAYDMLGQWHQAIGRQIKLYLQRHGEILETDRYIASYQHGASKPDWARIKQRIVRKLLEQDIDVAIQALTGLIKTDDKTIRKALEHIPELYQELMEQTSLKSSNRRLRIESK